MSVVILLVITFVHTDCRNLDTFYLCSTCFPEAAKMSKCEPSQCRVDQVMKEMVLSCEGLAAPPSSMLRCRFKTGESVPAQYDPESKSISCACLPTNGALAGDFDVVDEHGDPVMAVGDDTPLLYRCESIDSRDRDRDMKSLEQQGAADDSDNFDASKVFKELSFIDRWLAVWIIAAMAIGVILGVFVPGISESIDVVKVDQVSLPVALGLWLMMYPVLCKVRYEVLGGLFKQRQFLGQVGMSLVLNWVIGPALMTGLAWATLPDLPLYRNGVIMVGLARCIAMVLIWNQLAKGNPEYCALLVAVNSVLQILLYAPLAVFYLKVISQQYTGDGELSISFWDVARSVMIFLGAPLVAGIITRYGLIHAIGLKKYEEKFLPVIGPFALVALIYTIIILFAMQGKEVVDNLGDVARVAVPMVFYFSIMWCGTLYLCRVFICDYPTSVTQSFTASSNNFELAIAVCVGAFGIQSKEALAATVGPLIEVPVLLALVYVALYIRKKLKWK